MGRKNKVNVAVQEKIEFSDNLRESHFKGFSEDDETRKKQLRWYCRMMEGMLRLSFEKFDFDKERDLKDLAIIHSGDISLEVLSDGPTYIIYRSTDGGIVVDIMLNKTTGQFTSHEVFKDDVEAIKLD